MNEKSEREKILTCLAEYIVNASRGDPQWVRDFLERWQANHGTESADDLRRRCREEWKKRERVKTEHAAGRI